MLSSVSPNPWFECYHPRPAATLRLICFAHAGGGASTFNTWHRHLPPHIELCAVQLPGRETRRKEPFALEFPSLMDALKTALAPLHDRPVALFGYSLGGLIAFEYARTLRRAERQGPTHLIIGASRAPHRPADPPIHKLTQTEFMREVGVRYDGIPRAVREVPELLAYFLPVIRADLGLLASYRHTEQPPLQCPITAYAGTEDRITPTEVALWAEHTSEAFTFRTFSGGHFFITSAREQVIASLTQALTVAPAAVSGEAQTVPG